MNANLMTGTIVMSRNEARKAGKVGTDEYKELAELMRQAIFQKPKSHHFEEQNPEKSSETMNQIGG